MPVHKFETTLLQTGGTTTGIEVPADVLTGLGGGKKPRVKVTVNGFSFSTSVGSMGGKSLIPVSSERRAAAGLKGGDAVDVTLELDSTPDELAIPKDLEQALAADPAARAAFDKLPPSGKKAHVTALTGAKAADTRARRLEKVLATLAP